MANTQVNPQPEIAEFGDFFALLKPRVMTLVVFTAAVGLLVAPVGVNPFLGFCAILFIALGAGASGALNMWWDADIDQVMKRTAGRPIPSGRVTPQAALVFGLWLSVIAVLLLGLTANWFAAGFLAFTIFFYAVVYSMWLKRSTPQNIVIGGAAGAFPPMIGWAVATGGISIESTLMFLIIFMWTPPHFWALSLFMNDDYSKAGVPMMTVTHGKPHTRLQALIYTLILLPIIAATAVSTIGGPVFAIVGLLLSVWFLRHALVVWRRSEDAAEADSFAAERAMFKFSLYYLFALFAALLADSLLRTTGWFSGWPVWV